MKVLSLFDGVSCARLAIERVGISIETYYASEIDKYAIKVTQANRPDTIQLGSVTGVTGISDIDLLIGGSPCQDLSIAGKNRKGLEGERSGLFWEYVRILNEVKPKYFILENVASMPKEAKAVITEALGVEPIMINAALVSAQNRKRLFWTNIPGVTQPEDRGILLRDILEPIVDNKYTQVQPVALRNRGNGKKPEYNGTGKANALTSVETDSMVQIGNIGTNAQAHRVYSTDGKSVALSALGGGQGAKTGLYAVPVKSDSGLLFVGGVGDKDWAGDGKKLSRNYPQGRRIYDSSGKSTSLSSQGVGSVGGATGLYKTGEIIRKLTPVECERLQSMPDNWTNPTGDISNSQRYKMCGNAFNVDVVAHIISHMLQ